MGLLLPLLQSSLLLMLLLWLPAASTNLDWQCPRIPFSASRDFNIKYVVPSFSAGGRVQAMATYEDSEDGSAVFVATRNRLHVLGPDLQDIESLTTGPIGDPGCQTCASCGPGPHGPPNDTDTLVLVIEPGLPALVSCGSTLQGRCFLYELEPREKALHLAAPACLFSANNNHPGACPDCVASPLGTRVTVVEQGHASYFYVASSLDPELAASFSPHSISIRRLKADASGFQPGFPSLSVLPKYLASYLIEYVHSFRSGDFVYFLTVQPTSVTSPPSALQTRLARLNAVEPEMGDYRELVLDCHFAPKRRRRGVPESIQPYPVLQAAHSAPVDAKLAVELSTSEGREVLFGVFVTLRDGSSGMGPNSVVCAFPIHQLDALIEQGVERCCDSSTSPRPWRGLDFFQTPSLCPNPPGVEASSPSFRCRYFPLLASSSFSRVDLFNGLLGPVKVTALHVTRLGNVTVAHMGTADGRILQVEIARSINYLLYVSNFSLGSSGQPIQRDVSRLGNDLLFASGDKVFKVPIQGPGCRHFLTCWRCLRAQRFMGCGWCGDRCSRKKECPGSWQQDHCPPEITEFYPHSGPLRGSTRLTLCGSNFYLRPDVVPEGTHQITVGRSPCRLLPRDSSSRRPEFHKTFVEELECELEPLVTQAAGTTNVSLLVTNTPAGKHFRVEGSSVRQGFSFMEPLLTSIKPDFGPRAGGTYLTLEGQSLSVGTSRAVLVNGTQCQLEQVSEEQILCVTPPGAGTARVPVHLQIGGAEVPGSSWTFHYKEDPIVLDISPNCGYSGSHVTIHGQHLASVWHLALLFHDGQSTVQNRQCAGQFPEQLRQCRLPEYVVRNPQGWATGNLSAWGDGAAGFTLPGFRFLPPPSPPRAGLAPLKPEEHSVKFEYIGLGAVADCVSVNVTVGGEICQHELRGDVVVCPLSPSLQLGKDGVPLQICVDGGCDILGQVVRSGPGRASQNTLLLALLALILLVAALAIALVCNFQRRKKQLDDLSSLDRSPRDMSLSIFYSGSDYRSSLASRPLSREESSDSRDGTSVPLLRTESIRLKDLDKTLLAEVKDVLIPHERVVIHSDQVIGKGHFGVVYHGEYTDEAQNQIHCAVKSLSPNPDLPLGYAKLKGIEPPPFNFLKLLKAQRSDKQFGSQESKLSVPYLN
ncbi:hypothetical protein A6R68_00117 [Neotoma lepida]|uniref:Sema domain-containing protein n=1 Tax=Neotoma lepida TaxID=56216 RepID=A0A1A6GZ75_NEOLE|nr:hypothetical protein A6R68_00117 [Neotoma lepida]